LGASTKPAITLPARCGGCGRQGPFVLGLSVTKPPWCACRGVASGPLSAPPGSITCLHFDRDLWRVAAGGRFVLHEGRDTFTQDDAVALADALRGYRSFEDAHAQRDAPGVGPLALTLTMKPPARRPRRKPFP
jgi:hypothetical protein